MSAFSPSLPHRPIGRPILRTSLLPSAAVHGLESALQAPGAPDEELGDALAQDVRRVRARMLELVRIPMVREALFLASPDLEGSLAVWAQSPASEHGQKIEAAVYRYLARMSWRCTPFGLFAGVSTGSLGSATRMAVTDALRPGAVRRSTRLDMDYLYKLVPALEADLSVRPGLRWRPNSSLYRVADRFRYIEIRNPGSNRSYHLVATPVTPYLERTLERARVAHGETLQVLGDALVADDADVTRKEASEYVEELVRSQLLQCELVPAITGPSPLPALLAALGASAAGGPLTRAQTRLSKLDEAGVGNPPDAYRAVQKELASLPFQPDLRRLFQVDMARPGDSLSIGPRLTRAILECVELLHGFPQPAPRGATAMERFIEAFRDRYGGRELPLAEALDAECGIGFEEPNAPIDGLYIDGVPLGPARAQQAGTGMGARERHLAHRVGEVLRRGELRLELTQADLEKLQISTSERKPLPPVFTWHGHVLAASGEAVDAGEFKLLMDRGGVEACPAARVLGRFCHLDAGILETTRALCAAEATHAPDALHAEIVHLPAERVGNIMLRPLLRTYELPFLGRSGAAGEHQLELSDLRVSVVGDRVVLRSARHGREVRPWLTNAHNFAHGLPVYRFLARLAGHGLQSSLGFSWGALSALPDLPRVTYGRLILSRARWTVSSEELAPARSAVDARGRWAALQALRHERRLRRHLVWSEGDNELPVDLDNIVSIEAFLHAAHGRNEVLLIEQLPTPDEPLLAQGDAGHYNHQLVVGFAAAPPAVPPAEPRPSRQPSAAPAIRLYPPGSEWLYAKLYCGPGTADRLLMELVGPFIAKARAEGLLDRWFFIRYADPGTHLRLRIHGRPQALWGRVLPALHAAARPFLESALLGNLQLDGYAPEVERYGGADGLPFCEEVFCADSDFVVSLLDALPGDGGLPDRTRLVVAGVDTLLADLGLDEQQRARIIMRQREGYAREYALAASSAQRAQRDALSRRFREERALLTPLLAPAAVSGESSLGAGVELLRLRGDRIRAALPRGPSGMDMSALAGSLVHMHVNRALPTAQRQQEFVVFDLLERLYASRTARSLKERPRADALE